MARVLRGVTLAEAVLALGMTSIIILAGVALASAALSANQKGADHLAASNRAVLLLEQFVYSLPPVTDNFWTNTPVSTDAYQTDTVQLGNTTYVSGLYLNDASTLSPGLRMVNVKVSWASGEAGRAGSGIQSTSVSRLIYGH